MEQQHIRELLTEASQDTCSDVRRQEIRHAFDGALIAKGHEFEKAYGHLVHYFFDHFHNLGRPDLIPLTSFPLYAFLCGDLRPGKKGICTHVDVALFDAILAEFAEKKEHKP